MCPNTKRARTRRDDTEAAQRAIVKKLPHISIQRLQGLRDENGDSPIELVAKEQRKARGRRSYLSTQFWTSVMAKFNLTDASVYEQLPAPTRSESVEKEMLGAIQKTRADNPALRSTDDSAGYFERKG